MDPGSLGIAPTWRCGMGGITTIGASATAAQVIDAEGRAVAPGFIDGHTHMDAQIDWEPLGTSSCWHGVTSVVMGNCGFTLAPCAERERQLVMRNLSERKDISAQAMEAGHPVALDPFREFLDTSTTCPRGSTTASYVGHSACAPT